MKKILAMLTALALLLAGPGALAEETAPDGGSGPDRTVEIRFGGLAMDWLVTYSYPTDILVPASAFAAAGVSASATWDGGVMLSAGDRSMLLYPGMDTAYGPEGPMALSLVPLLLNGEYYVPACAVAAVFDCGYYYSDNGLKLELRVDRSPLSMTPEEKRINALNVSSDTGYLIWISKSEFTVRVFTGSENRWKLEKSFPCAIGAPGSPTIEGTFKYYQKQSRWSYANYYCGPVMRFYRGFAIHSVLMRYNGTYYDGRVGVKISHGCVRLRPADIQWMADTIPLYTTVYVTA